MKLWHGSPTKINSPVILEGRFHGMFFASSKESAVGLGVPKHFYTVEIPDEEIADARDFLYDHSATQEAIKAYGDDAETMLMLMGGYVSEWDDPEAAHTANRAINGIDEDPGMDIDELSWDIQKETAVLAGKLGYKAVAVEDEHGTSFIVLPGEKLSQEEG